MAYVKHFQIADDLIHHLNGVIGGFTDPFISSRYIGFVSIAATTVYELAIKEIFIDFGEKKHKVFGSFTSSYFERINGRIKTGHLKSDYLPRFGQIYLKRYQVKEQKVEREFLRSRRVSVLASYNNLIEWRNQFAHEGKIPNTVTYPEITQAYEVGKEIIHCLAATMQR